MIKEGLFLLSSRRAPWRFEPQGVKGERRLDGEVELRRGRGGGSDGGEAFPKTGGTDTIEMCGLVMATDNAMLSFRSHE